jgi:hypothetical protein
MDFPCPTSCEDGEDVKTLECELSMVSCNPVRSGGEVLCKAKIGS